MAFAEDFSVFLNTDGFGVEFIYTPNIGAEITATGVFDEVYFDAGGGSDIGIASNQPRIVVETSTISNPVYGEKITIGDKHYTIVGMQPDGTGMTTLILEVQDDPC